MVSPRALPCFRLSRSYSTASLSSRLRLERSWPLSLEQRSGIPLATVTPLPLNTLLPLVGETKDHAWGQVCRPGRLPAIADLLGVSPLPGTRFAEFWLGAHETAPSLVALAPGSERPLDALARQYPREILGAPVQGAGFDELPFLLKILSCDAPLSIQAHPDKALAERLHARDPRHYPDDNHKPEIAIALTDFEALVGFRRADDIRADLARHGLLEGMFAGLPDGSVWLRAAYSRLFSLDDDSIRQSGERLVAAVGALAAPTAEDRCFLTLWGHHPADRGTFSAYFLNRVTLRPGQSVFVGPNEPHAYLEGVIVECMANSNNVVRAGCTGKFVDREALVSMLTYREGPPRIDAGTPIPGGRLYAPPTREFAVEILELREGATVEIESHDMVSIFMVLDGTIGLREPGRPLRTARRGSAWLWPAALPKATLICQSPAGQIVRARPNLQ